MLREQARTRFSSLPLEASPSPPRPLTDADGLLSGQWQAALPSQALVCDRLADDERREYAE